MKKPKLTVAIPVYQASGIIWLAMNSMMKQKGNPSFEVVISVCPSDDSEKTAQSLNVWKDSLRVVGVNLTVVYNHERMNMVSKWKQLAEIAQGEYFMMVAADCFTPLHAVEKTIELMDQGNNWVQANTINFFDFQTGRMGLWRRPVERKCTGGQCTAFTNAIREMKDCDIERFIDNYIFKQIEPDKIAEYTPTDGVHTDGFNHISKTRASLYWDQKNPTEPFIRHELSLIDVVPDPIAAHMITVHEQMQGAR